MNPNVQLDHELFEQIEREYGPLFNSTLDDQTNLTRSFSNGPVPITQSLSGQLNRPFTPTLATDLIPGSKSDLTKEQIRLQIESDIQRELKQQQDMMQMKMHQQQQQQQHQQLQQQMQQHQQQIQIPRQPNDGVFTTVPLGATLSNSSLSSAASSNYDAHASADMRAAYRANGIPPPSDQYDELLRAWAKDKGVDLNSARKRKSEDFVGMGANPMHEQQENYTRTQVPKNGELDHAAAKIQFTDLVCGEKDVASFCNKVTSFLCGFMRVRVGGFYMNQRPTRKGREKYRPMEVERI